MNVTNKPMHVLLQSNFPVSRVSFQTNKAWETNWVIFTTNWLMNWLICVQVHGGYICLNTEFSIS